MLKNLKLTQKLALVIILLLGLFLLFLFWYKQNYSMEVAESYEVNTPALNQKLLIATQGSVFKDAIVEGIINHYKSNSIFVKVVDISVLDSTDASEFDAILLVHTWEYGKPPEKVQSFMDKNQGLKDKLVVLTTSGEGTEKMEGVDAITGESIISDVSLFVDKVVIKLDPLLEVRN